MINNAYEVCDLNAGAGGAALGWERAGFTITAIDPDQACCETLRANRPRWSVQRAEIRGLRPGLGGRAADVVSAKVRCPPLVADEGLDDLMPDVVLAAAELSARAMLITTAPALASEQYAPYRRDTESMLASLGYSVAAWSLVDAHHFGVAQHRPQCVMVALRTDLLRWWLEPKPRPGRGPTVAQALAETMDHRGLTGQEAKRWVRAADKIAPTIAASPPNYSPHLGATRAKRAWAAMGIDAGGVAADTDPATPSGPNGRGPQLTVAQISLLQGMPSGWVFCGDTAERARQASMLSNPQIIHAYAAQIRAALRAADARGA